MKVICQEPCEQEIPAIVSLFDRMRETLERSSNGRIDVMPGVMR
jgi:hypothetical protein